MSPMYLDGIDDVMKNLTAVLEQVPELTAEGLNEAAMDIGARAAEKAPVDTGDLRGSMTVDTIVYNGEAISEIRFNEKYAAVQHERLDFNHPKGGEAKYLEKAAIEKAEQVAQRVGKSFDEFTGGK